jgi:hypothetical protein
MLKTLSATAAAFVLMTGFAVAQDQQTTTHEKTTVQNPDGSQAVQANKTQSTTDGAGNVSVDKKSYSRTDNADGSQENRSSEQHTASPDGSTSNTEQQSTTTKSPE